MNTTTDLSREPCPDRILEDAGAGFAIGAVGGSIFHFIKGRRNAPNGHRMAGGATAVHMNAPRVGGSFAIWGVLFSTFDCALVSARRKEDPWNSIAAGAATGGLLAVRRGIRASGRSALVGGAFLALLEGAGIMLSRVLAALPPNLPMEDPMMMPQQQADQQDPAAAAADEYVPPGFIGVPPAPPIVVQEVPVVVDSSGLAGWFGGLIRGKPHHKVTASASGGDRRFDELELDLPRTAVPSFH